MYPGSGLGGSSLSKEAQEAALILNELAGIPEFYVLSWFSECYRYWSLVAVICILKEVWSTLVIMWWEWMTVKLTGEEQQDSFGNGWQLVSASPCLQWCFFQFDKDYPFSDPFFKIIVFLCLKHERCCIQMSKPAFSKTARSMHSGYSAFCCNSAISIQAWGDSSLSKDIIEYYLYSDSDCSILTHTDKCERHKDFSAFSPRTWISSELPVRASSLRGGIHN